MKTTFNTETGVTTWEISRWYQKTAYVLGVISFWYLALCFMVGFIIGIMSI